ncbi:hypothetical protein MBM_01794 [Drepanopeziza brunnea f. sp. 'multigermtubi' MB_m1]|uniref:Uncharacterized protein n=2 Tax=Drepanopeziza brunnea f. sp. 'multigermtubi' TaxID=698441 RepID=K1X475_MARBU|nr:uncharacterized protein MBM_01794 [Drepanopeziza brunnea f. sp. 'multigermtubi' MB_m1]EKD19842.1 hypothetical protein MBM_01794 [Drepanopeziza brunnea f. sp. 'multigermtubi' MB_m1]
MSSTHNLSGLPTPDNTPPALNEPSTPKPVSRKRKSVNAGKEALGTTDTTDWEVPVSSEDEKTIVVIVKKKRKRAAAESLDFDPAVVLRTTFADLDPLPLFELDPRESSPETEYSYEADSNSDGDYEPEDKDESPSAAQVAQLMGSIIPRPVKPLKYLLGSLTYDIFASIKYDSAKQIKFDITAIHVVDRDSSDRESNEIKRLVRANPNHKRLSIVRQDRRFLLRTGRHISAVEDRQFIIYGDYLSRVEYNSSNATGCIIFACIPEVAKKRAAIEGYLFTMPSPEVTVRFSSRDALWSFLAVLRADFKVKIREPTDANGDATLVLPEDWLV